MTQPINHHGVWVDDDVPVTGVIHNDTIEWLHEEIGNGVDLSYEELLAEYNTDKDTFFAEYCIPLEEQANFDFGEYASMGDVQSTYLIGSWKLVDDQYEPDLTGEYAAICGETYTQVIWSRYVERCNLCSPCYPGRGDIGNRGRFLTYTLPLDVWGESLEPEDREHIRAETVAHLLRGFMAIVESWLERKSGVKDVKASLRTAKSLLNKLEQISK